MFDAMFAEWRKERSMTQMTLGKLIDRLSEMDPYIVIQAGLNSPHSYRGYYHDIAFEHGQPCSVAYALELCRSVMEEVFTGYKGGEYQMGRNTPAWIADYGRTGQKIIAINDDGSFELANDEF